MSLDVRQGPRSTRLELAARPTAVWTALLLLAGIWTAFTAVWTVLVLVSGGSLPLALASLLFLPVGLAAAARTLAGMPDRWILAVDADRGLVAVRRGFLSRGRIAVPLDDLVRAEVAGRPGPGGLARPAVKLTTRAGEHWIGEGHSRADLERTATVFNEGVRTARAPSTT